MLDRELFTEIKVTDIDGVKIGNAENAVEGRGCTVFLFDAPAPVGCDVRGGGPASRDTNILCPTASCTAVNAILFSGGSAYGLDAAGGVMRFLEERGKGFDTGAGLVPLVVQSDIFDLGVGDFHCRPDGNMAYEACENAYRGNYRDGNYGAGTGATIGKLYGMEYAVKTGVGSFAVKIGELVAGAVVVLNALGDVYSPEGNYMAGLLNKEKTGFLSTQAEMFKNYNRIVENKFTGNTTLGAFITNAAFDKTQLTKIASMCHNGYGRCIRPVHTSADGDTIYASSVGSVAADLDMVGALSVEIMACAIERAVKSAESAYGYPCADEVCKKKG